MKESSAIVAVATVLITFVACTSTVVGTGNPPPGGTTGNNGSSTSTSGTQGSTSGGSTSSGTSGAACVNIAGVWYVSGQCNGGGASDTCTITQSECNIDLACKSTSFSGHVEGDTFTYSGLNDLGVEVSCSGRTVTAKLATGTCTQPDEPTQRCSFSASKQ